MLGERRMRIAIDGTASAGKGTLAKLLAQHLKSPYIDTGALYRSVAYISKERLLSWNDESALESLTSSLQFSFVTNDLGLRLLCDGVDITQEIRSDTISHGASIVSTLKGVRASLLAVQKDLAAQSDVIMDGRDIGTVIMPDADLKIFVDAQASIRAQRRYEQYVEKGIVTTYKEVLAALQSRDEQDATRAISPLKQAEDAYLLDTSHRTIEDSLVQILEWVEERK
jgi:cytidylate kinase